MVGKPESLDEMFEAEAAERAAKAEADDTPAARARLAAKRAAEHARLVAAGIITEDGEPGPNAPVDDADDEDEEGGDE